MRKEDLIKEIGNQMSAGNLDKQTIYDYLEENYKTKEKFPEGFDEMGQMLSLVEQINADKESEDQFDNLCRAIVYSLALIDARKKKIDILKVREDFEIEDLINKYKGEN